MCFFVFSTLFLQQNIRSPPIDPAREATASTTMLRATSIARRLTAPVLRTRQTRSDGCGDTEWGARVGTVWHTGRRRHDDVRATHPNRAHTAPPSPPPSSPTFAVAGWCGESFETARAPAVRNRYVHAPHAIMLDIGCHFGGGWSPRAAVVRACPPCPLDRP